MEKIGIVTLPGNFNYGNRLQNYALQTILEKRGYQVETLEIPFSRKSRVKKMFDAFVRICISPKLIKLLFYKREYGGDYAEMAKMKTPKVRPFTEKYLKTRTVQKSELKNISIQYDMFIVGSDQVWNQSSISDSTFFLDFVPYKKRYSYAASFGKSEIISADKKYYQKNLNGMRKISVRESQGEDIVKGLTTKDVFVHVDPTMLLTPYEWRVLASRENSNWISSEKFVLVYALRGLSDKKRQEIEKFSRKNGYKIITLMGDSIEKNSVILTVTQFIQAIDYAEFVVTDSFHGTVFSILFNTPFQVLERSTGNMNSRLDNLLEKFDFQKNSSKSNIKIEDLIDTEFSKVEGILSMERKKSADYFDTFLKLRESDNG
ncbi:polysaccharide pyruvyl transferase family protein [Enterococcus devriesei]|uniref:Polysaccharide pyruvyl transferase domain-containing protein n=1 Tax=Enterococcus devriesei TaxID=319970 RepID=A0A1L8SYD7_9ENTE|nr:polysaccharide pyruvyl transferase family protein [Enterococcus devriesei]OJG37079.1 hypothetical protein RV00_GL000036 [Enterococcus devriesei]